MADIIRFPVEKARQKQIAMEHKKDLTEFLREAVILSNFPKGEEINGILLLQTDIQTLFRIKLSEFLLKNNLCGSSDLFKCSLYVSELISQNIFQRLKNIYAVDFLENGMNTDNPWIFKEGGDLCFLLCVFFGERRGWKMMRQGDYSKMGEMFYRMFYYGTKKEIGWHMSQRYREIVDITKHCVKTL